MDKDIVLLARAAARLQKQAAGPPLGQMFSKGLGYAMNVGGNAFKGIGTRLGSAIAHPFSRALPAGGRALSPMRAAQTVGAAGAGIIGAGHANNAIHSVFSDPSEQYANAQQQYESMLPAQQAKLQQGQRASDDYRAYQTSPEYNSWTNRLGRGLHLGGPPTSEQEAQTELDTGNFGSTGGFGPSLGGLNPFAGTDASGVLNNARSAAGKLQSRYVDAAGAQGNPEEIQKQITQLQQRQQQSSEQMGQAVFPAQRKMLEGQQKTYQRQLDQLQNRLSSPIWSESPYAKQLRFKMMAMGIQDPNEVINQHRSVDSDGNYNGYVPPGGGAGNYNGYVPPGGGGVPGYDPNQSRYNQWQMNDRVQRYARNPDDFKLRPGDNE